MGVRACTLQNISLFFVARIFLKASSVSQFSSRGHFSRVRLISVGTESATAGVHDIRLGVVHGCGGGEAIRVRTSRDGVAVGGEALGSGVRAPLAPRTA